MHLTIKKAGTVRKLSNPSEASVVCKLIGTEYS